jgi:hypothetical protein
MNGTPYKIISSSYGSKTDNSSGLITFAIPFLMASKDLFIAV